MLVSFCHLVLNHSSNNTVFCLHCCFYKVWKNSLSRRLPYIEIKNSSAGFFILNLYSSLLFIFNYWIYHTQNLTIFKFTLPFLLTISLFQVNNLELDLPGTEPKNDKKSGSNIFCFRNWRILWKGPWLRNNATNATSLWDTNALLRTP